MQINFQKWQGNGNDFIIIPQFFKTFDLSQEKIYTLCNRRFGIGADGLILLRQSNEADFEMLYYNSDGLLGSMCGNGGRCALATAFKEGIVSLNSSFKAFDGIHHGNIISYETNKYDVKLSMNNVSEIQELDGGWFLNTGSPHFVLFEKDIDKIDVEKIGSKIRFSESFQPGGTNVNFIEVEYNKIKIRTYERGVEAETLSCGTGTVAAAIVAHYNGMIEQPAQIISRGGDFIVYFEQKNEQCYENIYLRGLVQFVFSGTIDI